MRISDWSSYVCSSDLDAGFCKIKNNFRVSEFDPGIIVVEILPFKLLIQIFFYIVARFGTVPAFCRSLPGIKAGCLISSGVNEGAGLNTSFGITSDNIRGPLLPLSAIKQNGCIKTRDRKSTRLNS